MCYRFRHVCRLFFLAHIHLDAYLDDFFFDRDYKNLIGASRDGGKGQVVSLIVGRKIADIDLPGMPHLGSGITFAYHGHRVLPRRTSKKPWSA